MGGLLVVISAPSGGGKTSVIKALLAKPDQSFAYSVSATTREPRSGEVPGKDYYFMSQEDFLKKAQQGEFVEWTQVHDHYYGTPKKPLEQALSQGKTILMDIDVFGGLEVKRRYPDSSLLIFLRPPSRASLIQRLKKRGTDSKEEIQKRLKRYAEEMEKSRWYDYIVVNQKLDETIKEVESIIRNHQNSIKGKLSFRRC
ncbi:MAG: guanylate kinase [candidate division KSB1 bacterium]|nr:guanylate kinase [candidate division KSB1 bacterium]